MIDTDNFKQINDSKGHMLGDIVLTEMASGMKKLMCEFDVVGCIGGDEFTIFMKNISSRETALQKAEDLSEMFRHLFVTEKRSIRITCSIGVAMYPDDGRDFKTLYKHADQALYQAKNNGVVGKWFDVSRAYIFETGENGEYYKNTYEWCNVGIKPEIDTLQAFRLPDSRGLQRVIRGEFYLLLQEYPCPAARTA